MRKLLLFSLAFFPCGACGSPVAGPESVPLADVSASVRFEPSAAADQVSNVVHVHLPSSTLSSGALSLFEGTLSSYYLGKFKHGEVPSTLASRQLPLVSWRSGAELVVAPLRPLAIGPYSLVSVDGLVAEFKVGATRPVLERWWPPAASAGSPRFALYCRPESSRLVLPSSASLAFEPERLTVELAPGVDESGLFAERCTHFESERELAPGEIWVPPPGVGDWALAPAIFSSVDVEVADSLDCESAELAFGPGCASVADDRLTVRTPSAALLWIVHTARGTLLEVSAQGSPLTIDGLLPDAQEHVWGRTHDLSGATRAFQLDLQTAPARERPILNEALADALGPEPQSEWVELLNDGTLAVDLAQYSLQDGGGRTPLPHESLAPHEYALLVRDDFVPSPSDEPPIAGARLIRLPTLGKSGLSNAGERLSLVDSAGVERSVLPALAGKPGQSLARRLPTSEDSDSKAFSFGTPTPGFANDAQAAAP
ncbi:MAG: lamin tail domain-containing protein [Pseudomonadota bacterium]